MALFKKRKMRPGLVRFLHRQLDDESVPQEQKDAIAKALDDSTKVEKINNFTFNLAKKSGQLEALEASLVAQGTFEGLSGPFLDSLFAFLKEHWAEILAMILKLFGI